MSAPALSLDSTEPSVSPPDAAPSVGALVTVRPGAIILTRHGEPALSRKCLITARQYGDWWAKYEVGGLLAGQTPPPELVAADAAAAVTVTGSREKHAALMMVAPPASPAR